jgi:hypothetical protein
MGKTKHIEFQIKAIELLDLSISAPNKPLSDHTTFQFDINLEHRFNLESRLLIILIHVTVFGENKNNPFGNIRTSCIYEVPSLPNFVNEEGKQFELPKDLIISLNSISVSTTRGIMFSSFRGTFLQNAVLPVIDPKSFEPQP